MNSNWERPPALHSAPLSEPKPPTKTVALELVEDDYKTILLGYKVGNGELDDGTRVEVIASGKTIEFRVDRPNKKRRAFRVDITPLASAAVELFDV